MKLKGYLFEKNNPELVKSLIDDFKSEPGYIVLTLVDSDIKQKLLSVINTYNRGPSKHSFAVWGSFKHSVNVKIIVRGSFLGKIKTPELLDPKTKWMPLEYTAGVKLQKYQFTANSGSMKGQKIQGVHFFLNSLQALCV